MKFAFEKLNYVSLFCMFATKFYESANTKKKIFVQKKLFHRAANTEKREQSFCLLRRRNDDSNKHKNEQKKVAGECEMEKVIDITLHLSIASNSLKQNKVGSGCVAQCCHTRYGKASRLAKLSKCYSCLTELCISQTLFDLNASTTLLTI